MKQDYLDCISVANMRESGWFAEVYTAPFEKDGRELAGSINNFRRGKMERETFFHGEYALNSRQLALVGAYDDFYELYLQILFLIYN